MTLQIDASSPAAAVGATATVTTASFSPPANSLLVAFVMSDAGNGSATEQNTVTSTGGLSWTLKVRANGSPGANVEIWSAPAVSAPGSITVSVTDNQGAVDQRLYVRVFTDSGGSIPAGIGATSTSAATSVGYTSTVANSWGWAVGLGGGGTPVPGASQTLQDSDTAFDGGDGTWVIDQSATTATPGTTVTMSVTAPGTVVHHAAAEILPLSTASPIPPLTTRTVSGRDYGEVQWLQKDRRNANLVGSAVNNLPSPLDSAWQASARYWHLYGDAADAAPRTWQSLQRNLTSDPALLAPVVTDPLTLAAGVGGDVWRRYNTTALQVDRREVPQQRRYVSDPGLLATAELENELLGGADTAKRYRQPATHVDRRETVPQRVYSADIDQVSIVGTGATGAWWGIDDTAAYLANTRRPFDISGLQQPTVYDPTLSGRLPIWQEYNQAALHVDRREVPQQRPYISDPSTYPQTAATDPLTLAWGVGGTYWLLYNTAALQVGRREVPQQRPYVSDSSLLATALLENELLGGADDWRRRYLAPAYADRREAPAQLRWPDPSLLAAAPTDPLLLAAGVGGDIWRRVNVPAYGDRRSAGVQRQPSDLSLLGVQADPLLLAGGVGGDSWRRAVVSVYLDRRLVPWQLVRQTFYVTHPGDVQNATSAAAVSAGRRSTSAVTGRRTSSSNVSDG